MAWVSHLWHLLERASVRALDAMGTSALAVALTVVVALVVTFGPTLATFYRKAKTLGWRAALGVWGQSLKLGGTITAIFWICLLVWAIGATVYDDHNELVAAKRELVEEAKKKTGTVQDLEKKNTTIEDENRRLSGQLASLSVTKEAPEQCWVAWRATQPRKQVQAAKSATHVIMHCNRKVDAPFEIVVIFDRDVIEPTTNVIGAGFVMGGGSSGGPISHGRLVRTVVSAPAVLANQLVEVIAHGEDEVPRPVQAFFRTLR
jgi:hypothetical protein